MAEALAVIGLVSAIVQFVDFGSKIVSRLNEYRKAGNDVPKTFQKISVDLPLIIDSLKRTKQQADAQEINDETATVLLPVVEACLAKAKELEMVLDKTLPVEGDSTWRSRKKALISVANEKAVKDIMGDLKDHLQILVHSQILNGPSPSSQIATYRKLLSLQSSIQSGPEPCFMVKFPRDRNFIGREDILNEIDRKFSDQHSCVAISGVGGVGKSQIAIEYCYRYRQNHPEAHVFWIHASSHTRFAAAYHKIGEELSLPDTNNPKADTIELVQKWLSRGASGPWLLVLDNADDIETVFGSQTGEQVSTALFNYLPQSSKGSVIVTTRDRRIGYRLATFEQSITVSPFEMNDAKQLLQKTLPESDLNSEDYTALLEALEFLPMAIAQAAAFMHENEISTREYLGYLAANGDSAKDLLAEGYHATGRDPESRNSVFQTWKISFDCIKRQAPRAAEILSLMSVLDRQGIQKSLLRKDDERDLDFTTAIGTLKALYLITEENIKGTFSMHRLVQLAMQRCLELEGVIEEWYKKAIRVVSGLCTDDYAFSEDWKSWGSICPHAQVVLSFVFQSEPFLEERALILHRIALHELERGYMGDAEIKARAALTTIERLQEDHPKKLTISKTVGDTLCGQDKFLAAERIYRQVFEERRIRLGPNHFETLFSLDSVAFVLGSQGKYEEAEMLQRQIVEAWTTSTDLRIHRFRAISLTNLANTLEMRGKYLEAEAAAKIALERCTETCGVNHPQTLKALSILSAVLIRQDKLDAAEVLAKDAYEKYACSLGPQHRYTLGFIGQVAHILEKQQKFEEAEGFIRPTCDALLTLVGPEHKETINALHDLAYTQVTQNKFEEAELSLRKADFSRGSKSDSEYQSVLCAMDLYAAILEKLEKWEEAEQLRQRVFDDSSIMFGPEHQKAIKTLVAWARALSRRNRNLEAEAAARKALRWYEDECGPDAQPTLDTLLLLAYILGGLAKYEEVEEISTRAFETSKGSLGIKHPFTVLCLGHLAYGQAAQGKFEIVVATCLPLMDVYLLELGPKHPSLSALCDWIADSLIHLRRYDEAELYSRRASVAFEENLGSEDSYTLRALTKLAVALEHQGKLEEAETIRRRILHSQEKTLGPEHIDTLTTLHALAWILQSRRQDDQALVLYQRACPALQKTFGPEHPITIQCVENLGALNVLMSKHGRSRPRYFPRLRRLTKVLVNPKVSHDSYELATYKRTSSR